jgi:rhodanese-related sulfurtransferase
MDVPEITVRELQELLASAQPPRLIDVRELEEWRQSRIAGAELVPLSEWPEAALQKLTNKDEPLLVMCHHGARSARATSWLLGQGYSNVKNVGGGIDAWSTDIDPRVPRYD